MEVTKLEKLQGMKSYNRSNSFFFTLIQYSLVSAFFCLFLSCPFWLPTLCSSLKLFFTESFPKMIAIVFGPRCLFIVFNLIIIFLVGESRLSNSCSKPDIYGEYVLHRQSLQGPSNVEVTKESVLRSPLVEEKEREKEKEGEKEKVKEEEEVKDKEEKEKEEEKEEEQVTEEEEDEVMEESEVIEEEEEVEEESEVIEEEEESGLPAEELNKRVEDFIARFNMQRRLEARMLVCCA